MESLAVGLLLFVIGSLWTIGGVILGWLYKMDKKIDSVCRTDEDHTEKLAQICETVDDHEGRISTLEEGVTGHVPLGGN